MFTRGFSTFCQSQHCIGNISCQTVHLVRYSVWQRAERLTGQPPWLSLSNNTRSSRPTGDSVLTTQSMYRHPENVCLRCSCINSLQVNALYSVTLKMKTFWYNGCWYVCFRVLLTVVAVLSSYSIHLLLKSSGIVGMYVA